jgi:hypothetical protein
LIFNRKLIFAKKINLTHTTQHKPQEGLPIMKKTLVFAVAVLVMALSQTAFGQYKGTVNDGGATQTQGQTDTVTDGLSNNAPPEAQKEYQELSNRKRVAEENVRNAGEPSPYNPQAASDASQARAHVARYEAGLAALRRQFGSVRRLAKDVLAIKANDQKQNQELDEQAKRLNQNDNDWKASGLKNPKTGKIVDILKVQRDAGIIGEDGNTRNIDKVVDEALAARGFANDKDGNPINWKDSLVGAINTVDERASGSKIWIWVALGLSFIAVLIAFFKK